MRQYELMTIYNIDLGEDGAKGLSAEVKALVEGTEGEVKEQDFWGKRKFAYEINHQDEGFYEVTKFDMKGENVEALKQKLNLIDNLVRYLITALEE